MLDNVTKMRPRRLFSKKRFGTGSCLDVEPEQAQVRRDGREERRGLADRVGGAQAC
jgi:hypothetical protein